MRTHHATDTYHREFLESSADDRQKKYLNKLQQVDPELRKMFKLIDKILDKTLVMCHTREESELECDLMRARWVLGMD